MEAPADTPNDSLTRSQRKAVAARGNVLIMAGAGTGKTHTLVERCLDLICNDGASLDQMLVVTFTEAAAAEVRERLREGLEAAAEKQPSDGHLPEQLALFDAAHIGTLHGFCFKLIREHFHSLHLDPQLAVLDEGQARLLADEILEDQFQSHYEGEDEFSLAAQELITTYGGGRDDSIRALVLRLHHYVQTRADAHSWLSAQIQGFSNPEPAQWRDWHAEAIQSWRDEWLPVLRNLRAENAKAAECLKILEQFPARPQGQELEHDTTERNQSILPLVFSTIPAVAGKWMPLFRQIMAADSTESYPARKKLVMREPLKGFFDDAHFLASLLGADKSEPLAEDWNWVRRPMKTLLLLANEFTERFAGRKRADSVVDFHDLEQFALQLLWETGAEVVPSPIASQWREKLRFIFVDEYQDINAAQDKIICALGRENRFLVGDVKQSIYRFRLADPKIFRDYARDPGAWNARVISLAENFRSREGLLNFVNSLFEPLMREEVGGISYDNSAKLKFGSPQTRRELSIAADPDSRVELLLREKNRAAIADAGDDPLGELQEAEREALMAASRLLELKNSGHRIWGGGEFRTADWRDFAVLLRSPGSKAEIYAKQFERAGVPLHVERGGFYDSAEISDLLSLLRLADNPLQDVPCIAVLRSPMVGCTLDELAEIRLAGPGHFWFATNRASAPDSRVDGVARQKIEKFLKRFAHWRKLARQASLSECLEAILAETHYDDWLLSRPRGAQRRANVQRLLHLAEQFDSFQRQGLFRFLRFVDAQREIEAEPEVAPLAEENAVRLMSIHQSKGLEFPVVVLADLAKAFNEQDLRGEIIFDERYGLCPRVKPPFVGGRYPSLAYWLARKRQRRELRGEELRLLYVALTRARDTLILSGTVSRKKWDGLIAADTSVGPRDVASAASFMDWLGIWFKVRGYTFNAADLLPLLNWRIVDDSELTAGPPAAQKSDAQASSWPALANGKLQEIVDWNYPFQAATMRSAKTSATALRREAAEADNEAERPFRERSLLARAKSRAGPGGPKMATRLNATDTGLAHHKFLQHFSLETPAELGSFAAEVKRLEGENYLSAEESAALDLEALMAFWRSEAGERILARAPHVRRELSFTAGFRPGELDEIFGKDPGANLSDETIIVQGAADLAVLLPNEIWLVDFKTDDVKANELPEKITFYSSQLKLYSRALEKIYSRPVTDCRLHFLRQRKTVKLAFAAVANAPMAH